MQLKSPAEHQRYNAGLALCPVVPGKYVTNRRSVDGLTSALSAFAMSSEVPLTFIFF